MTSTPDSRNKEPDISFDICLYSRFLEIVSNKWTALVIYALEDGSMHYGEIRRRIEGVSQKMLTQTLRQLERDGLVERKTIPTVPPMVEYSLSPLGASITTPMRQLKQWTTEHYKHVQKARESYDKDEIT